MVRRKPLEKTIALYSFLFLLSPASCHMEMSWPYPLRSKYNPANSYSSIDYSMTSPLDQDASNFPCKGYQKDESIQSTISYTAGSTYNLSLAGSATHDGGSCQLSLSYDNGATFRVIKSMIGGCPLRSTYDFTIPSYAPSGTALLAWTWQNLVGNREYYMDCAAVDIVSTITTKKQRRQSVSAFDELPYIWKANLPGINDCKTVENVSVVYPHPGPDVEYGDELGTSSLSTPGDCDAPTPYGQAYVPPAGSGAPRSDNSFPAYSLYGASSELAETSTTTPLMISTSTGAYLDASQSSLDPNTVHRQAGAPSQSYSTTTITADCPSTVTVTIYPSSWDTTTTITNPTHYTTVAAPSACTGTSASCPCASSYQCQELSPCTWACNAYTHPTTLGTSQRTTAASPYNPGSNSHHASTTTLSVTSTHSVTPVRPSSSSSPPGQSGHPPYATGDLNRYLPCVPGTFICTSSTTWDTCDYDDGSVSGTSSDSWVYGYRREVSDGMECVSFLSPYSSGTGQHAQQNLTPDGYYRDDRVVRARPDGDCSNDGSIKCIDNGKMFEVCDQGGWVNMGPVANGITCQGGHIVASGG